VYDALERAGIAAHLKTPVGSRGMHIMGIWPLVTFVSARDEANSRRSFYWMNGCRIHGI
jgi:hypothetical protein